MQLSKLFTVLTCQRLSWNVCEMLNFDTLFLVNRMNDQRTSYGTEDKRSSIRQIHVQTVTTFLVRKKTGPTHLALLGLTVGRQINQLWMDFIIPKILHYKLFGFLLCTVSVQCYYSIRRVFQSAFLKCDWACKNRAYLHTECDLIFEL